MPGPLADPFWQAENAALRAVIGEIAQDIMTAAATNAIAMLPAGAQMFIDWDLVNQDVLAYLNGRYLTDVIPVINGTTRRMLRPIIEDWIRGGEPLTVLEKRLVPLFGNIRAARIASTEITRLWSSANLIAWNNTGMVGAKVWRTAFDDRRCPMCSALEGTVVELGSNFMLDTAKVAGSSGMKSLGLTGETALRRATSLLARGASWLMPPAHVGCRCFLAPLLDEGMVREQIGRAIATGFFAKVGGRVELLEMLERGR